MKPLLTIVALLLGMAAGIQAATPAHIVIMTVEDSDNYDAVNSMRSFEKDQLKPAGYRVTIVEGDKPQKHHFDGLVEALKDADLLVLFSRRRFPPKAQLDAVHAYLDAGKPLLGIRTANHAFIPRPKETVPDAGLATWPEFATEVLGGQNAGYETKGLPYTVSVAPGASESPLLKGVNAEKIRGNKSLYKVLPVSPEATILLFGAAQQI